MRFQSDAAWYPCLMVQRRLTHRMQRFCLRSFFFFFFDLNLTAAEDRVAVSIRSTITGCVLLSDVLQDIKDELYHKKFVVSLAPPAGYDGSQHVIQDVEVPGRERLPIAPSHKSHLKIQTNYLQSQLERFHFSSLCLRQFSLKCANTTRNMK